MVGKRLIGDCVVVRSLFFFYIVWTHIYYCRRSSIPSNTFKSKHFFNVFFIETVKPVCPDWIWDSPLLSAQAANCLTAVTNGTSGPSLILNMCALLTLTPPPTKVILNAEAHVNPPHQYAGI